MTTSSPRTRLGVVSAVALGMLASGCMALTPQLSPTDFASAERVADRDAREALYAESAIYRHDLPQGTRYTKGTNVSSEKRSWQSLDAILRSDAAASEALPVRKLRLARLFTALGIATSLVTVAGIAASSREGLDLQRLDGTGAILLGGGLATAAFGITAGLFFTKARKGYDRAVDVYNDSLGVRLGLYSPDGKYIPPRGALVDKDGFILLDEPERVDPVPAAVEDPKPTPAEPAAPAVTEPAVEPGPAAQDPVVPPPQPVLVPDTRALSLQMR